MRPDKTFSKGLDKNMNFCPSLNYGIGVSGVFFIIDHEMSSIE